jgi:hypothetical protein
LIVEKGAADCFIDGVVAADVPRTIFGSPFKSKMPAAWIPPVRAKSLCASRSFLGSESNASMSILIDVDLIGGKFCRMASMLVLPQSPQLLEIVPKRWAEFSFTFTPAARLTIMILSRVSEIPAISRGSHDRFRNQKPCSSSRRDPACASLSPRFFGRFESRAVLQL